MKQVRREIDLVYNKIIFRLEALQEVDGEGNYIAFVKTWNEIVIKYRNILAIEEGRREARKNDENLVNN